MTDRAELKQEFERLQRAQAELVNSAKLATLGTLVAGVAHEINTPLGALHSNHDVIERALLRLQEILADEVVTPDELDQVRKIVRAMDGVLKTNGIAVERMVQLVDNLRSFGSPDRAEIDRVDLHEGIEGTLSLLGHELRDVELVREYGDLPPVECFPGRINQVFMNLLLNGIQAMQGAGTLTIRTKAGEDGVRIDVADTGVGIPPENLERIFDPGFTTKGARVGMGLGLLITRQIVDQHGGEIRVESRVGVGTTFSVRLPLRLAGTVLDPAAGETGEREAERSGGGEAGKGTGEGAVERTTTGAGEAG